MINFEYLLRNSTYFYYFLFSLNDEHENSCLFRLVSNQKLDKSQIELTLAETFVFSTLHIFFIFKLTVDERFKFRSLGFIEIRWNLNYS